MYDEEDEIVVDPNVIDLDNDAVNALCLKCTQTCKQSYKVRIQKCGYKPKKGV